jgi:TIGR03943 family protein
MNTRQDISASRVARCIAFLTISFSISWLAQGNRLASIVHPRMNLWIEVAGLLFLILAAVQMLRLPRKPGTADPLSFYVPIAFAIALVYLFIASGAFSSLASPASVDSLAVQNAIISKRDSAYAKASSEPLPDEINFDDDHYWALYNRLYDHPAEAAGHRVVLQGYFHRQGDYPASTGLVARNLMWCCSADMSQIGLLAQGPGMDAFPEKAWVEVSGRLSTIHFDFGGTGKASDIPLILIDSIKAVDKGYTSGVIFPF